MGMTIVAAETCCGLATYFSTRHMCTNITCVCTADATSFGMFGTDMPTSDNRHGRVSHACTEGGFQERSRRGRDVWVSLCK